MVEYFLRYSFHPQLVQASGKFCTLICYFRPFPIPISFCWYDDFEKLFPLFNGHSNRVFWQIVSTPSVLIGEQVASLTGLIKHYYLSQWEQNLYDYWQVFVTIKGLLIFNITSNVPLWPWSYEHFSMFKIVCEGVCNYVKSLPCIFCFRLTWSSWSVEELLLVTLNEV